MIKDKFSRSGKEQYRQLDTPKTEEKTTTVNTEGNKSEAPKKKKNIIRVYHAQNASDGGKTKKKPVRSEGDRPAGQRNADGQRNSDSSNTRQSADGDRPRRNNDRFGGNRRPQGDGQGRPLREITVREDVSAREDHRAKETVREAVLREITVREDVSAREDHRAKEAVREAVLREINPGLRSFSSGQHQPLLHRR